MTSINVQEGSDVAKDDIILGLSGDDLTESIQSASESLRSAEISMQNLQDTMNNYTITAPISGTIIEKDAKVGDAVKTGDTLCIVYDLSYLEMSINVDELQISSISVGQQVQITADAVPDKTYVGTVTRVSMKGKSDGGTTTYPVTIRIDDTDGLRPGMNANAEIVVAEANNALVVPNAAVVRGFPQRRQRRHGDGGPGGLRLCAGQDRCQRRRLYPDRQRHPGGRHHRLRPQLRQQRQLL